MDASGGYKLFPDPPSWWFLGLVLVFLALFVTFIVLYVQSTNSGGTARLSAPSMLRMGTNRDSKPGEVTTVVLNGGLGNQMFEIATAYAYALQHHGKLVMNTAEKQPPGDTKRKTYYETMMKWVKHADVSKMSWMTYEEPSFSYRAIPDVPSANVKLKGYFQSPKYFDSYRSEIVPLFAANIPALPDSAPVPDPGVSVSLHVRRTDYVTTALHDNTAWIMKYYNDAIAAVQAAAGGDAKLQILVFSDDLPWCRANLPAEWNMIYVDGKALGITDEQEMLLMSKCRYHIIANSSFSWWAAWLSKEAKLILAPKYWCGQDRWIPSDSMTEGFTYV